MLHIPDIPDNEQFCVEIENKKSYLTIQQNFDDRVKCNACVMSMQLNTNFDQRIGKKTPAISR